MAKNPNLKPTALKFHYQFNLRDFARVIQNLKEAEGQYYKGNTMGLVRMWVHECNRIWRDRLIFEKDIEMYNDFMKKATKEFGDLKIEEIFAEPNLYTSYVTACKGNEPAYIAMTSFEDLKQVLEGKLEEYNENVASMNLVLFEEAMEHISRICRIIGLEAGSALLVGVGGSGKQSLAKLSSFILGYNVSRITVTTKYKMDDLKLDIQEMFKKLAAGEQILFLLTDSQITKNEFLVYINDLLSSGYIPQLFPSDELDGVLGKIRSEAKAEGY